MRQGVLIFLESPLDTPMVSCIAYVTSKLKFGFDVVLKSLAIDPAIRRAAVLRFICNAQCIHLIRQHNCAAVRHLDTKGFSNNC